MQIGLTINFLIKELSLKPIELLRLYLHTLWNLYVHFTLFFYTHFTYTLHLYTIVVTVR